MIADEKNTAIKMKIIIKLLQSGMSENYLIEKGYSIDLIQPCNEIRNYLFICYRNLGGLKNE